MDNADEQMVRTCQLKRKRILNPIIDWNEAEVWEFIHEYEVPYCSLYDEGFKRLGCIGCPMGSVEARKREFERWPKYKEMYLRAFEKMIENRGRCESTTRQKNGGRYGHRNDKYTNQTADDIMQGYITERFKDYTGVANRLYPHAKTRVKDFSEMTPEEVMEWWIK